MLNKFEQIAPQIRVLAIDVDNTLVEVRSQQTGSILNYSLLIPILKFAAQLIPLAIDTARDKRLDMDFPASAGVSVGDLLHFLKKKGIYFSRKGPDLVVMSEDVELFRQAYMEQYQPGSDGWETYVKEKNSDLHMIMHRLNECGKKDDEFQPLKPEDILILDDSELVINQAKKAGFKTILVPLNFAPNATGTTGVDYLYELADLIGLEAYAKGYELEPEQYDYEPASVITIVKQYLAAKACYSNNIPTLLRYVHPELETNLVELISTEPKKVYSTLKKFKDRNGYNRLVDAQTLTKDSDLQNTLLGVAIRKNKFLVVHQLLTLGASANQVFDLSTKNRSVTPLLASILTNCHSDILDALLKAGAKIELRAELSLALNQFCSKAENTLNSEDYKRLEILIFWYQKRLGLDGYCQIIYPFFLFILKQKNPYLVGIFLLPLATEQKQVLFDLIIADSEFKLLILAAPDNDDQFTKQFILDFFFQIPLQNIKIIIELPLKLAPRDFRETSSVLPLCYLIQDSFLTEGSKLKLLTPKKRGSGAFFKTKKDDATNEANCIEKIEQLVLYISYLEKYYDLKQLAKVQATKFFDQVFFIVDRVKESRYCKSLAGDNKTAFLSLCDFLRISEEATSSTMTIKRTSTSLSANKLNIFAANKPPKVESSEKVTPNQNCTMDNFS